MPRYTTTIWKDGQLNATGIPVPAEVMEALGQGKRPKVVVQLKGYTYRSTVTTNEGVSMLPLSAEHRTAAGVEAGEAVEVTLEVDSEPRTVDVPDDLAAALGAKAGAREAFDGLAFSKRKEFVRQVNEAKAAETRARRIAGIVDKLP